MYLYHLDFQVYLGPVTQWKGQQVKGGKNIFHKFSEYPPVLTSCHCAFPNDQNRSTSKHNIPFLSAFISSAGQTQPSYVIHQTVFPLPSFAQMMRLAPCENEIMNHGALPTLSLSGWVRITSASERLTLRGVCASQPARRAKTNMVLSPPLETQ